MCSKLYKVLMYKETGQLTNHVATVFDSKRYVEDKVVGDFEHYMNCMSETDFPHKIISKTGENCPKRNVK